MNLTSMFNFPDLSRLSTGSQTGPINKNQPSSADASTQAPAQPYNKTDQADLSSTGLAAAQNAALAASNASPASSDVRMQLVNSIQTAIQAGTYNVPAADVADRMIQGILGNR